MSGSKPFANNASAQICLHNLFSKYLELEMRSSNQGFAIRKHGLNSPDKLFGVEPANSSVVKRGNFASYWGKRKLSQILLSLVFDLLNLIFHWGSPKYEAMQFHYYNVCWENEPGMLIVLPATWNQCTNLCLDSILISLIRKLCSAFPPYPNMFIS